jgi:hypothetical protein
LITSGLPAYAVDRDLQARRSVALFRGVHVDPRHAAGFLARVRAALATQGPTAAAAMQTSAALHQLRWVPLEWSAPDALIHLGVPPDDAHRHRRGLRLHRRTTHPSDLVVIHGILCFSVTRTLVELARLPLPELLVVQLIDGALLDGRTTKEDLFACADRFSGERNIAVARRRIARSRPKVRSAQETRLRLMLEDAGITVDVAIEIRDEHSGELLAEGDLGIKRLLLWGEYDGYDEHSGKAQFGSDRARDRWLNRRGWQTMRHSDADMKRPLATTAEWRQAIADAPARIAGLDPRRSPEVAEARRLLGLDP